MKLRLKNNSVRLRLTENEIAAFRNSGHVEETVEFGVEPHQQFIYRLESSAETETMRAIFENNKITIFVPKTQADEWTNTTLIGMESSQEIGGGKTLRLLVEKDFACLEPGGRR
jgi:hypothetical protein